MLRRRTQAAAGRQLANWAAPAAAPCAHRRARAQEHNGARSPLQQRLYLAAVVTLPALLGSLALFLALRHRPDPYWEEALGKAERPGLGLMQGLRTGFRDPAASAALRLLFVGNSFVHRNEGAETVRRPSLPAAVALLHARRPPLRPCS